MPWFKVDDGFATSEPVMRVKRRYRASVIGLWTLSGTWCAKELTDGRVPFHMIEELACTKAQADLLVECGLWVNAPEGYVFIGWEKYQPTRAKVEAERKKEAERKANYRMSRGDTGGTPTGLPEGHQPESGHPDPTRPDPTHIKEKETVHDKHALADEFAQFWSEYPRKQAKPDAMKAFKAARKTADLETILKGLSAYKLANIGQDKSLIKMPAGWLRSERWEDEQIINAPSKSVTNQPAMCPVHRDYPTPCDSCARDRNEGRDF